jgi:hypothetical protein
MSRRFLDLAETLLIISATSEGTFLGMRAC